MQDNRPIFLSFRRRRPRPAASVAAIEAALPI